MSDKSMSYCNPYPANEIFNINFAHSFHLGLTLLQSIEQPEFKSLAMSSNKISIEMMEAWHARSSPNVSGHIRAEVKFSLRTLTSKETPDRWILDLKDAIYKHGGSRYTFEKWPAQLRDTTIWSKINQSTLDHAQNKVTKEWFLSDYMKRQQPKKNGKYEWKKFDQKGFLTSVVELDRPCYATMILAQLEPAIANHSFVRHFLSESMTHLEVLNELRLMKHGVRTACDFVPVVLRVCIPSRFYSEFSEVNTMAELVELVPIVHKQMRWIALLDTFTRVGFFKTIDHREELQPGRDLDQIEKTASSIEVLVKDVANLDNFGMNEIRHFMLSKLIADLLQHTSGKVPNNVEGVDGTSLVSLDTNQTLSIESATAVIDNIIGAVQAIPKTAVTTVPDLARAVPSGPRAMLGKRKSSTDNFSDRLSPRLRGSEKESYMSFRGGLEDRISSSERPNNSDRWNSPHSAFSESRHGGYFSSSSTSYSGSRSDHYHEDDRYSRSRDEDNRHYGSGDSLEHRISFTNSDYRSTRDDQYSTRRDTSYPTASDQSNYAGDTNRYFTNNQGYRNGPGDYNRNYAGKYSSYGEERSESSQYASSSRDRNQDYKWRGRNEDYRHHDD